MRRGLLRHVVMVVDDDNGWRRLSDGIIVSTMNEGKLSHSHSRCLVGAAA